MESQKNILKELENEKVVINSEILHLVELGYNKNGILVYLKKKEDKRKSFYSSVFFATIITLLFSYISYDVIIRSGWEMYLIFISPWIILIVLVSLVKNISPY